VGGLQTHAVPASEYSFDELADIYNQTRIDYIVPMPMNAKRMKEYVHNYDIDLSLSVIATTETATPVAIGMLGVRQQRTWITRLGVVPNERERRLGSFLMNHLIDNAKRCGASQVQLEVIVGNEPAHHMFEKFGFQETRELLVIRRPPKQHNPGTHPLVHELRHLNDEEIITYLHHREPGASWVEESNSLINGGNLKGINVRMGDDAEGWAVFMSTRFQLQHIVLQATEESRDDVLFALLYYIHELYPNRDTKVENIPVNHPSWDAYQRLGYVVSFRRTEMLLTL
jgi:ribosomal protein S18 acetylase RimI-like enzyme